MSHVPENIRPVMQRRSGTECPVHTMPVVWCSMAVMGAGLNASRFGRHTSGQGGCGRCYAN
jgi:hypothetical protein